MDPFDSAARISIDEAEQRGISALLREVEAGHEQVILRNDKPVAVFASIERFEQVQRLQQDLQDLTLALARMMASEGDSETLDDVLERFGYTRAALAEASESELATEAPAKVPGPFRPVDPATHPLLGKWRIVEMALWDRDYLDMEEPGYIAFNERGGGEFVFGLVYGSLDCGYSPRSIDFTWVGNDEMDDASGNGWVELQDDGTLTGEIAFFQGDESEFKAQRW